MGRGALAFSLLFPSDLVCYSDTHKLLMDKDFLARTSLPGKRKRIVNRRDTPLGVGSGWLLCRMDCGRVTKEEVRYTLSSNLFAY